MNFNSYEPYIYQDQKFMDLQDEKFVILNFTSHEIPINFYPEKYPIINFGLDLNIHAIDLDKILTEYTKVKIEKAGFGDFKFEPLVMLPPFQPLRLLVLQVVSELCNCVYPITTEITINRFSKKAPVYFISKGIKRRIREKRTRIIENGLVVK
jgi:hypothetical protein